MSEMINAAGPYLTVVAIVLAVIFREEICHLFLWDNQKRKKRD